MPRPLLRSALTCLFLVAIAAPAARAQTVSCTGVPAWVATTTYAGGARVTYQGGLYQAVVQNTNVPPNYCPSCGWWSLVGTCGAGNNPPTATVTAPANNATFTAGSNIAITASASDSDGTVAQVQFRQGAAVLGSDTTAPYAFTWTKVAAGSYALTAVATDNQGATATSAPVNVTVTGAGCNTLPSVPSGLASPAKTETSVSLSWNPSTPGAGCTVQYRVFRNGTQAAQVATTSATIGGLSPNTSYSFAVAAINQFGSSAQGPALQVTTSSGGGGCGGVPLWSPTTTYGTGNRVSYQGSLYEALSTTTNVPPNHCLTCGWWRLVGPCGVGSPPTVSLTAPANGASFNQGATITIAASAADSDGTITRVEFLDNGTKLGEDTSAPYSFAWTGGAAGAHQLAARAMDNSGNTTTSSPVNVTITCTANCGGGLPKHVITGYWHNFSNGSTLLRLRDVPAAYNVIAVAFAVATGTPGAVTFSLDPTLSSALGYSTADFVADVNAINAQPGRKVIISVGGETGAVSVASAASAANFASSVVGLMNQFGFAGVDIDLENGVHPTFMAQALRSIKSQKPGAIITMAPQTVDMQSTGMAYFRLALDIRDILTIVNMQYYNSGTMNGCDSGIYSQGTINFLTALACIQLQNGLRPDQVGLGLPATPSAAQAASFVSPTVVNNALDCLAAGTNCGSFRPPQTWPGIRGAMTWSINWDATNGYNWVNTVSAHLPSVP